VLRVPDVSAVAPEPPPELIYHHHTRVATSIRALWASRDIVFTLAERDFRAQYKQATLGILWALLTPVATLAIFIVVFSRIKGFGTDGIPYPLYAFIGILCWTFFAQALGTGGNSLLSNNALLNKTQFPRECFPLESLLVTALNTAISLIPLAILFGIEHRVPSVTTLWTPVFMLVEIVFTTGMALGISAAIVQMRDLAQVLPIIISLGLFITPVIWPFSQISPHLQIAYGFINPLGPIIDDARRALFLGHNPIWKPFFAACIGSMVYLALGYRVFKRFEVNFADIA
jgi:ABC-type polysaccharide/polyol phosphate export permease